MKYSLDKYKFFTTDDKVIAVSTYCGKRVRGVAKCHPDDTLDVDFGKKLAAARCNSKIAHKRRDRSFKKFLEAQEALKEAKRFCEKMEQYYTDSFDAMMEADNELEAILENI